MKPRLFHHHRSSASYRVRIALALSGIDFDSVIVDLVNGEQLGAEFLDLNPQGLVPVLQIDGLILCQSLAIIEYLHDTGRCRLLPAEPEQLARVRCLSHAIAMEIHPLCKHSVGQRVAAFTGDAAQIDDWPLHYLARGFMAFERMLDHNSTGRFCHGDVLTLADVCLFPQVLNASHRRMDMTRFPIIGRVFKELERIPEIAAAHPDNFKQG